MQEKKAQTQTTKKMTSDVICQTDITGASFNQTEPEGLFFTNFTKRDAMAFFEIFASFSDYYKSNPSLAVDALKRNLKKQMDQMMDVCPMEVLLYSARLLEDYIHNRTVKNALISLIVAYIPKNPISVSYILNGWEWMSLLSILIEACGKTNHKESILMAMDACPKILMKFKDENVDELLSSYIIMVENAQNEAYIPFLYTLVKQPQFLISIQMVDFFLQEIKYHPFFDRYKEEIAKTLYESTFNPFLKRGLEKMFDQNITPDRINAFLMQGLSYDKKIERVKELDFTKEAFRMLFAFERSKDLDPEIEILICEKLLADVPKMRLAEKNYALIVLGTRGSRLLAVSLIPGILEVRKMDPQTDVCVSIALSEIDPLHYPVGEAMKKLLYDRKIDTWTWSVGKYFRFRKSIFEREFLSVAQKELAMAPQTMVRPLLNRLFAMLEIFHGNNRLLTSQERIQERIFVVLDNILTRSLTPEAFMALIKIYDFLLPINTKQVLLGVDKIKERLKTEQFMHILPYANGLIKKGDMAREPEE